MSESPSALSAVQRRSDCRERASLRRDQVLLLYACSIFVFADRASLASFVEVYLLLFRLCCPTGQEQVELEDRKLLAGLCPSCHRFGEEAWDLLVVYANIAYSDGDTALNGILESIQGFRTYFSRSGTFYDKLSQTSRCMHWCLTLALSDPNDPDFRQECPESCKGHDLVDPRCVERDGVFVAITAKIDARIASSEMVTTVNNKSKPVNHFHRHTCG